MSESGTTVPSQQHSYIPAPTRAAHLHMRWMEMPFPVQEWNDNWMVVGPVGIPSQWNRERRERYSHPPNHSVFQQHPIPYQFQMPWSNHARSSSNWAVSHSPSSTRSASPPSVESPPTSSTQPTLSTHPSFKAKAVCLLSCKFCEQVLCKRGMKAILLADTRIELFSTDTIPSGRVQLVAQDYLTRNCQCRIRDVACLGCGNVIGYHVTTPCTKCMSACHNGHFWMFHESAVAGSERFDESGTHKLLWAHLPYADRDADWMETFDGVCR